MKCFNCGKCIPKKTQNVYAPREIHSMMPVENWQYRGNMQVVSRRYSAIGHDRRLYCVGVWDGESYNPEYGFFCTVYCAARFGQKACEVGFKREGATK